MTTNEETLAEAITKLVDSRHFSSQLLAWASDPNLVDTIPNVPLLAGVLVEICHRMNALESRRRTTYELASPMTSRTLKIK